MTDPAKPIGADVEALARELVRRVEPYMDRDALAETYRRLLTSFLEAKAEEMAKVIDRKAELWREVAGIHRDSGRVEDHDRCYGTAQAIDECAAALRAVGKGDKR